MKEGVVKESSIRSKEVQKFKQLQSTTKAQGQVLFNWCIKAQIEKKPLALKASKEEILTIKRSLCV